MNKLLKFSALALFIAVGAFAFAAFSPQVAAAQEADGQESQSEAAPEEEKAEESKTPYSYTAQSGDSYTKIARKAVQTYGWNKNVSLSQAQIVAAETFLTSEAGFPAVNEGEKVELSEAAVEAAVKKAQDLDEAAQARWERYVKYVDFNTDNVGEARN